MLVELSLILLTLLLVYKFFLISDKPSGTPPGITGLPVVGAWPPKNVVFEDYIKSCRKKYGDIFWLKLGGRNCVFVCNYEDILIAFNNPALQGRPPFYAFKCLHSYGVEESGKSVKYGQDHIPGLVNSNGPKWKNLRKFIIRRFREGGLGKSSMEGIILTEAEILVEDLKKYVGITTELPHSINVAILNVIWKLIGDRRYDINDEEIKMLCSNLDKILNIFQGGFFIFNMIPRLVDFTPEFILNRCGKTKLIEISKQIFKLLENVVADHKNTLDEDNPRDLIDAYLIDIKYFQNDSSNKTDYGKYFSELELLHMLFDLFGAGSETTSSAIRWFILFMVKYPEIQRKVQDEMDRVITKDRNITLADRDRLPYLECCINETLRLKSILPFSLFHVATEDTRIGKYFIPKGTNIVAACIGCHKDPMFFEKPNEFYPEHFLNENNTFNNTKKGMLPFSTGKRVCVGEQLARMDLFLVLGALLHNFTFSTADGQIYSEKPSPKQPLFAIPEPFKVIINYRIENGIPFK